MWPRFGLSGGGHRSGRSKTGRRLPACTGVWPFSFALGGRGAGGGRRPRPRGGGGRLVPADIVCDAVRILLPVRYTRRMSSEPPRTAPVLASLSRPTARLVFAIALAAVGIWVARGFLIPLSWSLLVAVALWPLYRRVVRTVPFHWPGSVAPLLFTVATALVLVVPLGFAAVEVGHEGEVAIEWLGRVQDSGLPEPRWLEQLPAIGSPIAGWGREHLADPQQLKALIGDFDRKAVGNWTELVGGEDGPGGVLFFVTL